MLSRGGPSRLLSAPSRIPKTAAPSMDRTTTTAIAVTGGTLLAGYALYRSFSASRASGNTIPGAASSVTPSPLRGLSPAASRQLAYPPQTELLPGRRDVATPWGNVRCYEFGNPSARARKVVFLHGISTPCISLRDVATQLANEHGCRVLLFDLFGRGFTDAPDAVPHDGRLYAALLLTALAHTADPAAWSRFVLVGYSLGGGLAADFCSWYPERVRELVLLAPGGIVRRSTVSLRSRVIYSQGYLPERLLEWLVWKRLGGGSSLGLSSTIKATSQKEEAVEEGKGAVSAELPSQHIAKTFDYESAVAWQVDNHAGFVRAYMSCIRHAPIHGQHPRWRVIGARQAAARSYALTEDAATSRTPAARDSSESDDEDWHQSDDRPREVEAEGEGEGDRRWAQSLDSTRVLLLLGETDTIVKPAQLEPDAVETLGEDNVAVVTLKGAGHELPISHSREVVEAMVAHWSGV